MILFHINNKRKTIHGPEPVEECNLDDADLIDEVGFAVAATAWHEKGFQSCGHCLEAPISEDEDD